MESAPRLESGIHGIESRIHDCPGFLFPQIRAGIIISRCWIYRSQYISLVFRTNSKLADHWEVHFDDVTLAMIIGEGAFGKVYSGDFFIKSDGSRSRRISSRWRKKDTKDQKKPLRVAVKMLRSKIYDHKNFKSRTFKSPCRPASQSLYPSPLS